MSSAPRESQAAAAGGRDDLDADAVPFPLRAPVVRLQRRNVGDFQRMRQHRRAEYRLVRRVGFLRTTLQPVEQRAIGWLQAVPHLLDVVWRDATHFRQRDLCKPRGRSDPQSAGDQLQERQAGGGVRAVEPARDDPRQLRFRCGLQHLDDLSQGGRLRVHPLGGPDQRHGLGQVTDIVVGPVEQHRIDAGGAEFADQAGLGGGEAELAGDRSEADAAVRVRLGREIAPQQRDLGVARGGEDEAFQQVGECDHGGNVGQTRRSAKPPGIANQVADPSGADDCAGASASAACIRFHEAIRCALSSETDMLT